MSENLNVFPNAKSKLLGEDTHAAQLDGSAGTDTHAANLSGSLSESIGDDQDSNFGTSSGLPSISSNVTQSDNIPNGQVTVNVVKDGSIVIIAVGVSTGQNNGPIFDIEEATVVKGSGSIFVTGIFQTKGGVDMVILFNVSAGNHTYDIIWTTNRNKTSGFVQAIVIEVDDTHAANLSGSQGTDTHAANLIGDNTQTTHEQAVLPA